MKHTFNALANVGLADVVGKRVLILSQRRLRAVGANTRGEKSLRGAFVGGPVLAAKELAGVSLRSTPSTTSVDVNASWDNGLVADADLGGGESSKAGDGDDNWSDHFGR